MPSSNTPLVEVLIPTLNEAENIGPAVANASQLGPVFVLDSFSTDGTAELARAAGATVVEHTFVDYASQKNWGLEHLPFSAEWVFILDADERLTPALRDEVLAKIGRGNEVGFYVNRQLIFMGRTIRHGGLYPSWNLRLFRRGVARYEQRAVHEHVVCDGPTGFLRAEMLHIRRETMTRYVEKHIRYANLESDEWVKWRFGQSTVAPAGMLFPSHLGYRQWLRRYLWPRLPFRPFWRFLWMYFIRFGFLDGRPGWHLACLMTSYEYMITLLDNEKMGRKTQEGVRR
jgi:glycosyltransferase involved in cell wall biosynthesis